MNNMWLIYGAGLCVLVFVLAVAYVFIKKNFAEQKVRIAEESAKKILEDAKREADTKRKEAILELKDEKIKLKSEIDQETKERRQELLGLEKRLLSREEALDDKLKNLDAQKDKIKEIKVNLEKIKVGLEEARQKHVQELERVSGLSQDAAKAILLQNLDKELDKEASVKIKQKEDEIRKIADKKAREILTTAVQRCAVDHAVESTVSLVELPSDDMKGRIIGREGRNIRAFETATGIDLVVDDTPGAVILSGFDPLRRETARLTLNKLIADGRIHPARVEEMYNKSKQEIKDTMWEAGERAALDTDVHNLPPVIIQLLGRLKYRTSYGQNVLQHSIEVAHLAGMLGSELGVNARLARRAGLLHDLGKAIDQDVEGTHTKLGAMFAKKAGESPEVVHAIEAHHEDIELQTIEAILVLVADAISASRPGARRDTLEAYIKRLQRLEEVAKSFEGVEKCYAIQAGREVRVIVEPTKVDDAAAPKLAHDIAKKIEAELEYPGEVKVTIIRETRASDIAK
ncbi:MAG: ribonuclease Y [Candidatus Margulisbacteria bacterium]|nr:ribonuclease Y [Candidatus Margulisiibacteriota bacterium]MBU1021899.1 ribonuclease Y [Candidatus Margulisiibacteriota bacterium]MBU1728537.1 ribonuclease Y [Candidatus Margulisiibacteriota bacterium]MBU1954684.1 ribonuclease Y [Candidatus Margulisiibacteriota bacterium]